MNEDLEHIKRMLEENNKLLKENNEMLKRLVDPEAIRAENENDFFMNVVANIVAKQLERKYNL